MNLNVVSFLRPAAQSRDWSNQDLAEFYRVEAWLVRSGIAVTTDRGLSDEGDPWFVFCRADTGDVIVHFAHIDGDYFVASPAFDSCARGRHFRPLIQSLLDNHPLIMPQSKGGKKLFIHPAALLVGLVTTCFFKLGQTNAFAAEMKHSSPSPPSGGQMLVQSRGGDGGQALVLNEQAAATVLTAIATAASWSQSDFPITSTHLASQIGGIGLPSSGAADSHAWEAAPLLGILRDAQPLSYASHDVASVAQTADGPSSPLLVIAVAPAPSANGAELALLPNVASDNKAAIISHVSPSATPAHVAIPIAIAEPGTEIANASPNSGGGASPVNSDAAQEIGLVLGGSVQTHVVSDNSAKEPTFVLNVAQAQTHADVSSPASVATPTHSMTTAPSGESVSHVVGSATLSSGPSSAAGTQMLAAEAAIQQFTSAHPDFQIIYSGEEIILYDPHLTPANLSSATEKTFSFPDGSSVFLIGLPAQQTHIPALIH